MNNNNTPSAKNQPIIDDCKFAVCECGMYTAVCLVSYNNKIWFDVFQGRYYIGRSYVHHYNNESIPKFVFDIANYDFKLGLDADNARLCSMAEAVRFYRTCLLGINQM